MQPVHPMPVLAGAVATCRRFQRALFLIFTLCVAHHGLAQPEAIGPEELSHLRQQTEFSGDWSETDAFDLDQYVTLPVILEGLVIPEVAGNVYLWFSTTTQNTLTDQRDLPDDFRFKATLQSSGVLEKMDLSERELPRGTDAVLRGWLATDLNISGSVLLVDDIEIVGNDRTFSMHAGNPKMESRRQDAGSR